MRKNELRRLWINLTVEVAIKEVCIFLFSSISQSLSKPTFLLKEYQRLKNQKPPKPEKQKPSNYSKFLKKAIDSKLEGKAPPKLKIKPQKMEFKRSTRNDTKFDKSAIYELIKKRSQVKKNAIADLDRLGVQY